MQFLQLCSSSGAPNLRRVKATGMKMVLIRTYADTQMNPETAGRQRSSQSKQGKKPCCFPENECIILINNKRCVKAKSEAGCLFFSFFFLDFFSLQSRCNTFAPLKGCLQGEAWGDSSYIQWNVTNKKNPKQWRALWTELEAPCTALSLTNETFIGQLSFSGSQTCEQNLSLSLCVFKGILIKWLIARYYPVNAACVPPQFKCYFAFERDWLMILGFVCRGMNGFV